MSRLGRTLVIALLLTSTAAAAQTGSAWMQSVADASRLHAQGRLADAISTLRQAHAANPSIPDMHVLQLVQYLTEYVTESKAMARAEADKLLTEAAALCDDVVRRKREVRMAWMAKSLVLRTRAERVETNAGRQKAVLAESERAYESGRAVNADGTPVVKDIDDLWFEVQRNAFTRTKDGKDSENVAGYERFVAVHPTYGPAHLAIGRYYENAAAAITDRSPKATATRMRHLELALAAFKRAADDAYDPTSAVMGLDGQIRALGVDFLNRPAEAAAVARVAVEKYPDHAMLVVSMLGTLLPNVMVAADGPSLRAAREALPATPEARAMYGMVLWSLVYRAAPPPPRETSRTLLAEAVAAFDAALKQRPEYLEALMYKSVVLKLQAERVEQDPARIKALLAEAEKLNQLAQKLMKR